MAGILVVDDEPEILHFIGTALADEGFTVAVARDGRHAVDVAEQDRPDLVVLDMMLPRMDGAAVATELRRMYGELPILLITADGRAAEKAQRVGAFSYLPKPFDLDRLLSIVRTQLGGAD